MSQKNLVEEIKKRVKDAKDILSYVKLNENDPELLDQISLGDNWDHVPSLSKAVDMHPLWSARWKYLLKTLKNQMEKLEVEFKTWESIVKEDIEAEIFNKNLGSGMTANNAKPTGSAVDRKYQIECVSEDGEKHSEYKKIKDKIDSLQNKIDMVKIVVDAFDVRTQMLIQLSGLLRSTIDNKILIPKNKSKE